MDVGVSNEVVARSSMGRFISACEDAATETVRETIERGAQLSRDMAPVGHKEDKRTPKLKDSISTKMTSRTSGHWESNARHTLAVERGGRPHDIPGNVTFFWEREWRMWEPGENTINHPGNPAQPFLRPAYQIVMGEVMQIARRKYPNG